MPPRPQTSNFASLPIGGKIFILFAGLAVLTAVYYLGFHMSLEEEIANQRGRHAVLEKKLADAHARQKEYLKLREELATRENIDKQYMRILPPDAEIAAFLDDLNRLAELSGLEMGEVQPGAERQEEFFVRVPVGLTLGGRYHQLAKFFYNISRLERAINMENIKLEPGSTSATGEVTLKVAVQATTFRRKSGA